MSTTVATTILCLAVSSGLGAGRLETDFQNPPMQFKSQPLWHMNGALETGQIRRQLQDAHDKSGFSGVAVLPVKHTRPDYLSEDYFVCYGDILETCKSLGMRVIFYDDIGFPSGSAAGQLKRLYPEHLMCRLDMLAEDVTGPRAWSRTRPQGTHMAAVAMNTQTLERREMTLSTDGKQILWQVPTGTWKLMIFTCVRDGGPHVDYLCPESIEAFFTLTYDKYYDRFSDHFGSTIKMTFFDDIGLRKASRRNWTPGFNAKFERKYNSSPALLYPALWSDIGPDTAAARVALFGFRAELLSDGFPCKVQQWAAAHGVQSSGHAMGQYHPQPTFLGADHIKFYEHSDIPMIDSIHYYGHGRPGFKLTSSASCSYDRPLTAVEIYGNFRKTFDADMLYRNGMELFARGANVFLPHGMWYNPESVYIKPLISDFNPDIAADLAGYNDWVGRASLLLQGGRPVADIGVLYPVAAMQAHARLDAVVDQPKVKGNVHPGLYVPPECDFNMLSDSLTGGVRRDFTFLHPEILDDRCEINGPLLRLKNKVNHQAFKILVIPGCRVIHWSNLKKIKAFYDAGGKVVATTMLPSQSAEFGHDQDVQQAIEHIFGIARGMSRPNKRIVTHCSAKGGAAYFVPAFKQDRQALADALTLASPVADVRFGPGAPLFMHLPQSGSGPPKEGTHSGMLSYIHKVKNSRNIYYFANSTDEDVEMDVVLRGKLKLECWNPHDGTMEDQRTNLITEGGIRCTQTYLMIDTLESIFFVEKHR